MQQQSRPRWLMAANVQKASKESKQAGKQTPATAEPNSWPGSHATRIASTESRQGSSTAPGVETTTAVRRAAAATWTTSSSCQHPPGTAGAPRGRRAGGQPAAQGAQGEVRSVVPFSGGGAHEVQGQLRAPQQRSSAICMALELSGSGRCTISRPAHA